MNHAVEFIANPTQKLFIESKAEADLFESRKGEGKSAALAWAIFYHTYHNPGARWVAIRDTFENIRRTTMAEFFHWFPQGVFGHYLAGEKKWVWDTSRCGMSGEVYFMGLDDENSAGKIASMPLAGVAIDEPTPAAGASSGVSEFVFDTGLAQLRQPGMKWYAAKLASNNADEGHWTYRRFWEPGTPGVEGADLPPEQDSGFRAWQTREPENVANLPAGYYSRLERSWAHRPDLLRRFVKGKHGFQQVGRPVTPQWSDELHLAHDLKPVAGMPLYLLWDGGLNPTCIVTQVTPLGYWLIMEAMVGEGVGMYEHVRQVVKPVMAAKYRGFEFKHIGDPTLDNKEQSSSEQSAARVIMRELGGPFIPGLKETAHRIDPLNAVLQRTINGRGMVQVDREQAKAVWHALRGGWHFRITRGGQVGTIPKNIHSHPGDATGYGAGKLFPLGALREHQKGVQYGRAAFFNTAPGAKSRVLMPKEGFVIGGPK